MRRDSPLSVLLQLKMEFDDFWHSTITNGGNYAERSQKLYP